VKTALRIGWILLCLALALSARCWNLRDIFIGNQIYFVDADCYSRMSRAAAVVERPGTILRHHDFENWPEGTTPHTTAPLDYLIAGLKGVLDLGFAILDPKRTSILHGQTLDLAGAILSPLLGLAGTLFLALWLWKFRIRYGGMALLLYAISPILVHGTLLGRPDHQSLLIFLLTVVAGSELALAAPEVGDGSPSRKRFWSLVGGVAWGLSLWVSWYEPSILFVVVAVLWIIAERRSWPAPYRRPGAFVALGIVVLSIVLEGWRIAVPGAAERVLLAQWAQTIGELAHLDWRFFGWLGWSIVVAPVLLFLARKNDRRAVPLLAVLLATFALTCWQVRWGYFLGLAFVWALPWQMQIVKRPWVAWLVFAVSLWPLLREWDTRLFPSEFAEDRIAMKRAEMTALRDLAMVTTGGKAEPVLAPWWLSPAVAYWTRNPCVGGSSHESLPGILDTARFFLSTSPEAAGAILRTRQVRWVLTDEPSRVIGNSALLLAMTPPPDAPIATTLMNRPDEAPAFLQEWKGTAATRGDGLRFYRLYRVDDAILTP
jgi:hypothetical protein